MNVTPKTQTTYLGIRLTESMKGRLEQEAARRSRSGQRVTTTDVVRFLINAYLPAEPMRKEKRKQ